MLIKKISTLKKTGIAIMFMGLQDREAFMQALK
jgi:hypothetical protein